MSNQARCFLAKLRIRPELSELEAREVPAVTIRFDYTYDTSEFFRVAERRAALQRAAQQIAPRVQDSLAAIEPSGRNTWQTSFYNPSTQQTVTQQNPTIRTDEIVVYIGATPLTNELGLTTSGGLSASGTRSWLNTVTGRGQAGATSVPKTDFATWGGMITFNSTTNWNFGSDNPTNEEYDFTSVALHELFHVFGFGLGEAAFTRHISGGLFRGPNLVAANGGPIAVVGSPPDHFAHGTSYKGAESPMQPSLSRGVKRSLTPIDYAVLKDLGWQVSDQPSRTTTVATPAPSAEPSELALGRFAVGTDNAAIVYGSTGEVLRSYQPFGAAYSGGIRVVTADVTGDNVPDLIVGNGPGLSAAVAVVDGLSFELLAVVRPFESEYIGGVYLAADDVTGDGFADLIVTPDQSGGPVVVLYDGASLAQQKVRQINRFFGLNDSNFRGGLRPALGDVNNDGVADLVVSAGFGGGPRVALWDGRSLDQRTPSGLAPDFFAFETNLRNGAYITLSDVDGDGFADVVAGAGPGGAPRVTIFSGSSLLSGKQVAISNFFAGNTEIRSGVRVATTDVDNDGQVDILAATESSATIYASSDLTQGKVAPPPWMNLSAPGYGTEEGITIG